VFEVREFIDLRGKSPFGRWFDKLNTTTQARITTALDRLERGNTSLVKAIGSGVNELRLDFGPGYRLYFGWDGPVLVILLGGGTKKRQQDDIAAAQALWQTYRASVPGEMTMALTKSFNATVKSKLHTSEGFRRALLREALNAMISGDLETGKSVLRKYINGTIGFVRLGTELNRSPKVLMRMLGPTGNPQAKNLFVIVAFLQKQEGTSLEVVDSAA
jgi:putative addiction module killer protein